MSEIPQQEQTGAIFAQPYAMRLGAALLIALALILILTWRDNARRSTLEVVVESSALGDTNYLPMPEPPPEPPYAAVALLAGKPLYPAGFKRHERREGDLVRVAVDDRTGLSIYKVAPNAKGEGKGDSEPVFFLKIGPGEFLKVRLTNRSE